MLFHRPQPCRRTGQGSGSCSGAATHEITNAPNEGEVEWICVSSGKRAIWR